MFIEIFVFQSFHFISKSLSLLLLTADILSAIKYVNNSYSKAQNTDLTYQSLAFLRCVVTFLSIFLQLICKRRSFFSLNKFRPTVHALVLTENEQNSSSVKQSALSNGSATQMASAGDGDRVRVPLRAQISEAARRFGSGVSAFFSRLFGKDRENPKVAVRQDPPAQRLVENQIRFKNSEFRIKIQNFEL